MTVRRIRIAGLVFALALLAQPSGADLLWSWSFENPTWGTGAGTFTTTGELAGHSSPSDGTYAIIDFSATDNSAGNAFSPTSDWFPDGSVSGGQWTLTGSPSLTISEGLPYEIYDPASFDWRAETIAVGDYEGTAPGYELWYYPGEGPFVITEMEQGGDSFYSDMVLAFLNEVSAGGGDYFDRIQPLGNPDRTEIARALDALRADFGEDERYAALFETLDGIEDDAQLQAALGELSPARLEKTVRSVLELSDHFHSQLHDNVFDTIPSRLVKNGRAGARHASLWNAFQATGVDVASGPDAAGHADAEIDAAGALPAVSSNTPAVSAAMPGSWHAFVTTLAGYGSEDEHDGRIGQRWWATGFQAGADYALSANTVVGFAGGYSYTDASERAGRSEGDVHTGRLGPYVGFARGDWVLDAGTTFGLHWIDDEREALSGGRSKSEHDAWDFAAHGSFRFDWEIGNFRFGPVTQMHFIHVEEDGYTENSGLAPLRIESRDTDSLSTTVGMHAAWSPPIPELDVVIDGEIGWVHEYMDDAETMSARFAGAPGSEFRMRLPEADSDGVRMALGADLAVGERWRVRAGWEGAFTSHVENHTGTLSFQTHF